jgi:hypothetical protein
LAVGGEAEVDGGEAEVDGGGGGLVRTAMFHPHGSPMRSEESSESRSRGRIRSKEGELLPLMISHNARFLWLSCAARNVILTGFYKCPNNFLVR